jgi:hypothetical protein
MKPKKQMFRKKRTDKTIADTLEQIQAQFKAAEDAAKPIEGDEE